MANVNAPFGGRPCDHIMGMNFTGKVEKMWIPSTDPDGYWIGDFVSQTVGGSDALGIPQAARIDTGSENTTKPCGIVVGIFPTLQAGQLSFQGTPLTLENIPIPATKTRDWYVQVNIDPYIIFEIQDDGASALTSAAVGKYASFTASNGASTTLAYSGEVLATATVGAGNTTYPFRILGASHDTASNSIGKYCKWRCMFNTHQFK